MAGDRAAGTVRLELPTEENTDLAVAETLVVAPDLRGTGIGTVLLEHAVEQARSNGRRRLQGTSVSTRDTRPGDDLGAAFALRHGARRVYALVHYQTDVSANAAWRGLDWPLDATEFEPVLWGTVVPDDLVDDVAVLDSSLSGSGQSGDDSWEPAPALVRRIREFEAMRISRGRRAHQIGLRHRKTGRLVGRGVLSLTESWPNRGLLANLVLLPEYRSAGVGGPFLLEALRQAPLVEPGLEIVESWTVESNPAMRALNSAVGMREVGYWTTWELSLANVIA
jgi:GNAT superfamily N-acetyltransferase